MSAGTSQGPKLLNGFKHFTRFDKGLGAQLPEAYRKFWREWKNAKPTAVHYIPKEGTWERDEFTGLVKPIQDVPIPLIDVPESNRGIWGGEAVIKGFQKRNQYKRRVPHFWVPLLRRSAVYSAVLDEYMSMVVTERTINLIFESHGFDHYLLKTPACDLRSILALKLKAKILQSLSSGCPNLKDQPDKQAYVLKEYGKYLEQYTNEEIEWYGLTFNEAINKLKDQIKAENPVVPHKIEFRKQLIEQLKNAKLTEGDQILKSEKLEAVNINESSSSWFSKMNPFGRKHES
ncbi:39S ribosomal protein L28, mitochondrial [Condylostylus longicornis]|uniref:39S ribosomal protein L28, mitochondrial n=1 Tax=Condylostylus longicornis TaxID=2530218 RepID=UPI00244D9C03|nr:39S ribosomal protein L28, mitochondrial [Condylostylus longicornis]